jgi:two-component system nitrate/nitrite sensor histidine kinase NarX
VNDDSVRWLAGFNHMAITLQSLYEQAGGARLKPRPGTSRRSALKIESLYKVSAFLASADTIEELSRGFAKRDSRRHESRRCAAVRWSDDANQRYLMLASDCFPQEAWWKRSAACWPGPALAGTCGRTRAPA